ncbi:uncharacterized protein LOC108032992 [Drosophila biarmipes]|uniref:uncharacterized protein LOC108032992 n=1 Tax=Drosophila biarmipes TaxID=125945 RepID=UPI0007E62B56|nr:uncharacterized protein LOC108032992 [Drosophila biarmipes]
MRKISALIILLSFLDWNAAHPTSSDGNQKENAFSKIVPRLLWNIKRGYNQESHQNTQPIIIVKQPSWKADTDSDRHHYSPFTTPYYPYYPQPPMPSRPPPQFHGMDYLNSAGGGPTYLIINPNNMQGIYLPASSSNSSNSTSSRRSAFVPSIVDLLQGFNLDDLADGSVLEDGSEEVNTVRDGILAVPSFEGSTPLTDDDHGEEIIKKDEVDDLERQTSLGLSPKHFVSVLMENKLRRRVQEVLAGIYLRNYNLKMK